MMFGDLGIWRGACCIAGLWAVTLAGDAWLHGAPAQDARPCKLEAIGTGTSTVRRVIDGRTFLLANGQEVRLTAIEVPPLPPPGAAGPEAMNGLAAKAALESLFKGHEIALKRLGVDADRYGRVLAFAFVSGSANSAQETLLTAGHARVAARVGDMACAVELLGFEQTARTARLGLWADPYYGMRRAEHPADVLAERGRFTLVEGKVLSVRESRGTIYMNFGRRWSEDFTVTVLKRNERSFSTAGRELKKLSGKTVRIRGVVEERGGPWIEATRPEQIEIAERD